MDSRVNKPQRADDYASQTVQLWLGTNFGTEILGTLTAVYRFLIAPIGWKYALAMWGYALIWFLFNDMARMLTYRVLREQQA